MAEVTDYTKYMPIQPPNGYIEWVLDNNRLGGEYIIYRQGSYYDPLEERGKRAVKCRCTACGNEYYLEDKPDEPYFTLEFNFKSLRVMQNRGYKNCARTPEVQAFEDKWVEFVKQIIEKERKAA